MVEVKQKLQQEIFENLKSRKFDRKRSMQDFDAEEIYPHPKN